MDALPLSVHCKFANLLIMDLQSILASMKYNRRLFVGVHLRRIRESKGYSQKKMAEVLSISASYLSQIEHDDRPLTAKLADKLARLFPVDWQDVALDDAERLTSALSEAVEDPSFSPPIDIDSLAKLAQQHPAFAKRYVEMHEAYRRNTQQLEMADEAISQGNATGSRLPWEEVRDWFHVSNNYVDLLDRSAESLASGISGQTGLVSAEALQKHLADEHGITASIERSGQLRQFDRQKSLLRIDAGQPPTGIQFQLAYHVAVMSLADTISQIARDADLRTDAARELLKVGLANYAAGAVLMPYEHFRQTARESRHDVDRLALIYRTSFEQTCHRLSTLQRDGSRGLPVFFCRVDMAGNITKRHSATRLQFARFGGACPLWVVHEAVAIPDRILVQLAETPDGVRYVSMAKGLIKPSGSYDRNPRRYAVALGCEAAHARDFVYADSIDVTSADAAIPIGASCRICPRTGCNQRAYPPSDQMIRVDLYDRGIVPYSMQQRD